MTERRYTYRKKKPASGHRDGRYVRMVCAFEPKMFEAVKKRAMECGFSVAEQIRTFVQWGLDAEAKE